MENNTSAITETPFEQYSEEEYKSMIENLTSFLEEDFVIDKIISKPKKIKHFDIISKNLIYPQVDIEDEKYKKFESELTLITDSLDNFEQGYKNIFYITYKFKPNDDNVIIGEVEICPWENVFNGK